MNIRQYSHDDESAVISLWQRCNLTRPWNNPKLDIDRKMEDSPDLFLVGEKDGTIVASIMAGYDGHRGWVHYVAVAPEYQKRGFGKQIINRAEEKLKAMGCPKIDLMVRNTNTEAMKFYEKIGYGKDEVIVMSHRLIED